MNKNVAEFSVGLPVSNWFTLTLGANLGLYDTKEKICQLALEVSKKVGITFASIDIIETTDNKLLVLEANSGVTINKAINFIPNGYNVAKNIYKEAIIKMFAN